MVNINGKPWDKLGFSDVVEHLNTAENETLFFEYKQDDETTTGIAKEISAFANTYGGYVFIGVSDNKEIKGCNQWDENRVHTTVYGNISPSPVIDVKTIVHEETKIVIIRIEEGLNPPYITNKGSAYERISSGSYPIKDSGKLSQLYYKRKDQLNRIKNKIELGPITDSTNSNNLCGCIDIGFALTCSSPPEIQKKFPKNDIETIANQLRQSHQDFSISLIGYSYFITVGRVTVTSSNGEEIPVSAGMNNFIEIRADGSIRMRILLTSMPDKNIVNIATVPPILNTFIDVYSQIMGNLEDLFVEAYKYEQLQVIKQFTPAYVFNDESNSSTVLALKNYLPRHRMRYGNNLVINGNRTPVNDYVVIDRHYFDTYQLDYNNVTLIEELFNCSYLNMGYIDPLEIQ